MIMADDLGYGDLGCYGGRGTRTPHIDSLASQGIRLIQAYANSCVCSPTRLALITGRYQYRMPIGLEEPLVNAPLGIAPGHPTMPGLIRGQGYRTSLVGKWHLGSTRASGPQMHGYDRFYGILKGGADYFSHRAEPLRSKSDDGLFDGAVLSADIGYLTDLLAARAACEIEEAARDRTPLFLSLHFTAPHWPWEGPKDHTVSRSIGDIRHFDGGSLVTYAAMLSSLDRGVGRVLDALRAAGLEDDSIVVFTSDNGGERFSDVWPLVGMKGELLEGGIRVPVLVRWPGRIAAGGRHDQVMATMDWLPTLLSAAGGGRPPAGAFDGLDMLPVLTGATPTRPRTLFWRHKAHDQMAVRDAHWKLLRIGKRTSLFDLSVDERERADMSSKHPDAVARLVAAFEVWNRRMLPYTSATYSYDAKAVSVDRY